MTPNLSLDLPDIRSPPINGLRASRQARRELSPEEERSLLGSLGHTALSGLETAGNILDTVGAMSRNALAGRNPLIGSLNPSQRMSGRQLLEHYRIVGPNQEGAEAPDLGPTARCGHELPSSG